MPSTVDARGQEPLDDDAFWGLIAILDGKTWERTIARLDAALAAEADETILRFAQTLHTKLNAIDFPEFCEERVDDAGVQYWDANTADHHRGAVIAGGRERFDLIVADRSAFQKKWLTDFSWAVARSAVGGWRRKHREIVSFVTTVSAEPGSNAELWAGTSGDVRTGDLPMSATERAAWDAKLGYSSLDAVIDIDSLVASLASDDERDEK